LTSFLNNDDTAHTGFPKAYINWIFLDDQFNYVSSLSGSVLAASSTYPAGSMNLVAPGGPIALNKSGYMYIWVSNETTGWDVYYDNLSVQYKQGPLLEENHYYPFGLTMAGISDKAVKTDYAENKYRFNGGNELQNKEFRDGSGLEMYDAGFRMLDPQLGRFTQIDPMADRSQFNSAYSYANDNPILMNDPTGLRGVAPTRTLRTINTIGGPSIDQINQISGINNNMGADAGPGQYEGWWSDVFNMIGGGIPVLEVPAKP
jgi:RHS repeat-associated protein